MYTNWKDPVNEDRIRVATANNVSISGMCRELGIKPHGGNIRTIRHHVVRLNLDTEHHTGQAWNRDNFKTPDQVTHKKALKEYLLRTFGHRCWQCERTEWQGQPIPLEMDHINGINHDNVLDNLRILCCNCHALTPTFRNRKRR